MDANGPVEGEGSRPPTIGVVIVAFNDPAVLGRCLDSLGKSLRVSLEIIVADNSTDDRVFRELPKERSLHYLSMGGNTGFCRATNAGIRKSQELGTRFTLLLNHDTVVMPECLVKLVECCASNREMAVVGGKILYLADPGRIWYAGGRFSLTMGVGIHDRFNEEDDGRKEVSREVDYATGCCMLIPTAAFSRIGPLREEMFMYLDDAEYSLRIRRAGYTIRYEPLALLFHEVGPGRGFRSYSDYYLYFSIRNKPLVSGRPAYRIYLHAFALALGMAKLALYGFLPGIENRAAKLRAICWGGLDSLTGKEKYRERFPRLFQPGTGNGTTIS